MRVRVPRGSMLGPLHILILNENNITHSHEKLFLFLIRFMIVDILVKSPQNVLMQPSMLTA